MSAYMNDLLSLGVMGFRVDAAKHMWPGDLLALVVSDYLVQYSTRAYSFYVISIRCARQVPISVQKTNVQDMLDDDKNGDRPLVYQEVIDHHTEPITMEEYFGSGKVTEFNYGSALKSCIQDQDRNFECLRDFGDAWFINGIYAVVFVDNHDTQRNGEAMYYDDGTNGYEYKLASAFHLAHSYGLKRVMSSYYFSMLNTDAGPPGSEADEDCGGGWVCEHRWPAIMNMVQLTNACIGHGVENYDVQGDVVGFSRGNCGFAVIGEAQGNSFYTGMPDDTYCDIISECAQVRGSFCCT